MSTRRSLSEVHGELNKTKADLRTMVETARALRVKLEAREQQMEVMQAKIGIYERTADAMIYAVKHLGAAGDRLADLCEQMEAKAKDVARAGEDK